MHLCLSKIKATNTQMKHFHKMYGNLFIIHLNGTICLYLNLLSTKNSANNSETWCSCTVLAKRCRPTLLIVCECILQIPRKSLTLLVNQSKQLLMCLTSLFLQFFVFILLLCNLAFFLHSHWSVNYDQCQPPLTRAVNILTLSSD